MFDPIVSAGKTGPLKETVALDAHSWKQVQSVRVKPTTSENKGFKMRPILRTQRIGRSIGLMTGTE